MDYEYFSSSDSTSDNDDGNNAPKKRRKPEFRPPVIYIEPSEFKQRFRYTPRQFELLLQKIGPHLDPIAPTNHATTAAQNYVSH